MPTGDFRIYQCHCGAMGYPLNSISCPVHGQRVPLDEERIREIVRSELTRQGVISGDHE